MKTDELTTEEIIKKHQAKCQFHKELAGLICKAISDNAVLPMDVIAELEVSKLKVVHVMTEDALARIQKQRVQKECNDHSSTNQWQ